MALKELATGQGDPYLGVLVWRVEMPHVVRFSRVDWSHPDGLTPQHSMFSEMLHCIDRN